MTRVSLRGGSAGVLLMTALSVLGPRTRWAQADAERLRTAKTLFFDRKYAEARQAWEAVRATAKGTEAETAAYWVARCSENLGESERALKEYDAFLALRPKDRALVEEARTSRVSLAAKLYKAGNKAYVGPARGAHRSEPDRALLHGPADVEPGRGDGEAGRARPEPDRGEGEGRGPRRSREARADALGPRRPQRVRQRDRDRAPTAPAAPRTGRAREAHWVHVRITEKGGTKPKVSINLPLALAELVFKSLPDDAKADLRREGYDAENFWDRLRQLGPSEIISIEGDEGERIQIWTEE